MNDVITRLWEAFSHLPPECMDILKIKLITVI